MSKNLKGIIAILLASLMLLTGMSVGVFADGEDEPVAEPAPPMADGFICEIVNDATATIVGFDGISGAVVIPQELKTEGENAKTYPITAIASGALRGATDVTSIEIPAGIEYIAEGALNTIGVKSGSFTVKKSSLESITVNDENANYASKDGILYNKDLTVLYQYPVGQSVGSFTVPAEVTKLGAWSFAGAKGLSEIVFSDALESIGGAAFLGCGKLKKVELPENIKEISDLAFCNTGLRSVEIPAAVEAIGAGSFSGCKFLTSFTFAENSTCVAIRDTAFYGCTFLRKLDIPASVINIGNSAFLNCRALKVSFADDSQLEKIGDYAFSGCTLIGQVSIPDSVTFIGQGAFMGAITLRIKFGENSSLTRIGTTATDTPIFAGDFLIFSFDLPVMTEQSATGSEEPGYICKRAFASAGIFTVKYAGTMDQFKATIQAATSGVVSDLPLYTSIKCSDGTIRGTEEPIFKITEYFKSVGEIIKSIFAGKKDASIALEGISYDV